MKCEDFYVNTNVRKRALTSKLLDSGHLDK